MVQVQVPFKKHDPRVFLQIPNTTTLSHVTAIGSSQFFTTIVKGTKYFVKNIVKRSNKVLANTSPNQVFKRILNEVLAAHVYEKVYGLHTLDMRIIDNINGSVLENAPDFLIGSKYEDINYKCTQQQEYEALAGLLVDCIMGNWDVHNNNNFGVLRGEIIRTDVGGCLAYRGLGDENLQFVVGLPPKAHIFISAQKGFKALMKRKPPAKVKKMMVDKLIQADKTFPAKLAEVKSVFKDVLADIADKSLRDKYVSFVATILDVISYRHKYYMDHCEDVLESMFAPQSGGDNIASRDTPVKAANIVTELPSIATMSSSEFEKMLKAARICRKK